MSNVETINDEVIETSASNGGNKRMAELNKTLRKLGGEAAQGKDSLPKLAHAVCRAASEGIINDADAEDVFKTYANAEGNKAVHERSVGGAKANVSKLRQIINLGMNPKVDGVEVLQNAFEARIRMSEVPDAKVKSAYAYYVDVARAQAKSDDPLSKDFLEDLALKDGPSPKTLEGELSRVLKVLEGLVTGENRDKIQDDSELTEAAYHAVKDRLDQLEMMTKRNAMLIKAKELGLTLA